MANQPAIWQWVLAQLIAGAVLGFGVGMGFVSFCLTSEGSIRALRYLRLALGRLRRWSRGFSDP